MRSLEAENKKRRSWLRPGLREGRGGRRNGERGGEPRSQLVPKVLDLFGLCILNSVLGGYQKQGQSHNLPLAIMRSIHSRFSAKSKTRFLVYI